MIEYQFTGNPDGMTIRKVPNGHEITMKYGPDAVVFELKPKELAKFLNGLAGLASD